MGSPTRAAVVLAGFAAMFLPGAVWAGWDLEIVEFEARHLISETEAVPTTKFMPYDQILLVCKYRYAATGKPGDLKPWKIRWRLIPAFELGLPTHDLPASPGDPPDSGVQLIHTCYQSWWLKKPGTYYVHCYLNFDPVFQRADMPEDSQGNSHGLITITVLPPPVKLEDAGKGAHTVARPGSSVQAVPPAGRTSANAVGQPPALPGAKADLTLAGTVTVAGIQANWGTTVVVPESAAKTREKGNCQIPLAFTIRNDGSLGSGPVRTDFTTSRDGLVTPTGHRIDYWGVAAGGALPVDEYLSLRPGPTLVTVILDPKNTVTESNERNNIASVTVNVIGTCIGFLPPAPTPTIGHRGRH